MSTAVSKKEFLKATYQITVMPDGDEDDPGYMAVCPQLSGLIGYGKTESKAIGDFHNVKSDWYDLAVEASVPIPLPSTYSDQKFSGKFVLRLSPELHRMLNDLAESEDVSLNSFCTRLLKRGVASPNSPSIRAEVRDGIRDALPELAGKLHMAVLHSEQHKYDFAREYVSSDWNEQSALAKIIPMSHDAA